MSNITPSVGRKVWYFANASQTEPIDATVIKVHTAEGAAHPASFVNLDVVDPDTGVHRMESWVQAGSEGTGGAHYRWMPYQVGQAQRAERERFDSAR